MLITAAEPLKRPSKEPSRPFVLWRQDSLFPGGGFLLQATLASGPDGLTLTLPCPKCTGTIIVQQSKKRMAFDGRSLEVERFRCPYGTRFNPCGGEWQIVPVPHPMEKETDSGKVQVHALIR